MATPLTRQQARDLALELMATHGLIEAGWSFRFNRAKGYAGIADLDLREISLSGSMVDVVAPSVVRETILHEIAHALTGEDEEEEHGPLWKAKAIEIGASGEEEEMSYIPQVWTSKCPNCGTEGEEVSLIRWRKACSNGACTGLPQDSRFVSWVEIPQRALPIPGRKRSMLAVQELEARLAAIGPQPVAESDSTV